MAKHEIGNRALASTLLAVLLLLLLIYPSSPQPSSHTRADAQFAPSLPSTILVGYSPKTLSPLSDGIPVFSQGDQIWVQVLNVSQPLSFSLLSPSGNSMIGSLVVQPNTVALLYTILASDPEGGWTLHASIPSNPNFFGTPLQVVSQSGHSVGVTLSSYSMQSGQLNLGLSVPPTDAHNLQGCLISSAALSVVKVPIPSSIGSATELVTLRGANANVTVIGTLAQSFSTWFVLEYNYSYSNLNATQLVTRSVEVARSDSLVFTSTVNETTTINQEATLRAGSYALVTYFDSEQGLSVQVTQVLFSNSEWFWLSSCNPFAMSGGNTVQKSVSITGDASQWPSGLLSTYDYRGVEMVDFTPLSVQIARVDIAGSLPNDSTPYPVSELGFSVLPNQGIEASSFFSNAIYVASSKFPLDVQILPTFGNQQFSVINTSVPAPFTDSPVRIPVGKVTVQVFENANPARSVTVQLANGQNGVASLSTDNSGSGTFYIPAGHYSLSARIGNTTELKNITVANGNVSLTIFNFQSSPLPSSYTEELVISIVIGAVISIYAWVVMPRQRRYSLSK